MGPESRGNSSSDDSQRLTYKDLGVELAALKPKPDEQSDKKDNVVHLDDYRPQPDVASAQTEKKKHARNKKIKAVLLTGATLLAADKLIEDAMKSQISPAARIESASQLESLTLVEIDNITTGTPLEVSPYSYTITGGNIRTSPHVESNGGEPDTNLVQHTDMTGKVITHPIEVADQTNSANGDWFVFYDASGKSFAVYGENLEVIPDKTVQANQDLQVTVDKTTSAGVIAHDKNNVTMQVATIIDVQNS